MNQMYACAGISDRDEEDRDLGQRFSIVHYGFEFGWTFPIKGQEFSVGECCDVAADRTIILLVLRVPEELILSSGNWFRFRQSLSLKRV